MKTYAATMKEQSIVEIFTEMMDQIYYEGYVDHTRGGMAISSTSNFPFGFSTRNISSIPLLRTCSDI